jgi:Xaa-Pro dipeptidase
MSKHDFTEAEFRERQARVRRAIGEAGLDWLLVFHPVSIHWLIGAETKSYQAFQCLPISAEERPLVMFTRESERCEFENDTLADEVVGWGGGEPEDQVDEFARLTDRLGLRRGRIGIEVSAYYLHPHHYGRLKDLLGAALVAEPSNLVHDLKLVKSAAEIALIREAARIADQAMEACVAAFRPDRTELDVSGAVYQTLLTADSGLPASTINLISGERLGFSHGTPTLRRIRRGDGGNVESGAAYKRYTATLGQQFGLDPPPARIREIHDIVRAAGDAMIAEIRARGAGRPAARGGEARHRRGRVQSLPHPHLRLRHRAGRAAGLGRAAQPVRRQPLHFGGGHDGLGRAADLHSRGAHRRPHHRQCADHRERAERLSRWGRELIVINE